MVKTGEGEKPVAILRLDTRSYGPAECEECDCDLEELLLLTDGSLVCPECKTPVEGFGEFSEGLTSAEVATPEVLKKLLAEYHEADKDEDVEEED